MVSCLRIIQHPSNANCMSPTSFITLHSDIRWTIYQTSLLTSKNSTYSNPSGSYSKSSTIEIAIEFPLKLGTENWDDNQPLRTWRPPLMKCTWESINPGTTNFSSKSTILVFGPTSVNCAATRCQHNTEVAILPFANSYFYFNSNASNDLMGWCFTTRSNMLRKRGGGGHWEESIDAICKMNVSEGSLRFSKSTYLPELCCDGRWPNSDHGHEVHDSSEEILLNHPGPFCTFFHFYESV